MKETKILRLLRIEADELAGDIISKEKGIYKKLTFVFEDKVPKQKLDKKGNPMTDKDGEPVFDRYYYPAYRGPGYIIMSIFPELQRIEELLDSGSSVLVEVSISEVEYEGKFYKRILYEDLRTIKLVVE